MLAVLYCVVLVDRRTGRTSGAVDGVPTCARAYGAWGQCARGGLVGLALCIYVGPSVGNAGPSYVPYVSLTCPGVPYVSLTCPLRVPLRMYTPLFLYVPAYVPLQGYMSHYFYGGPAAPRNRSKVRPIRVNLRRTKVQGYNYFYVSQIRRDIRRDPSSFRRPQNFAKCQAKRNEMSPNISFRFVSF